MPKLIRDIVPEFIKEIKTRTTTPELQIKSLPTLNSYMHGWKRGEMVVIGARSSCGKSAFAVNLACDLLVENKKVLFLSLEMSNISICERFICNIGRIPNIDLLKGRHGLFVKQIGDAMTKIEAFKLGITEEIGWGWKQIDDYLNNLPDKPDVIILDYIQNIKTNGLKKEVIDDYLINFRKMCVTNNVVGIVLSQVNRGAMDGKDKTPAMHQLKSTGNLEESADKVILISYPYKHDPDNHNVNDVDIMLVKNRNGMTGNVKAYYQPEFYRYSERIKYVQD